MTWDAYQNVWEDLVPQGYIVAFPRTEGSISPVHAEFGKDLKFLVTKLKSESAVNVASLFYNHINTKSAIMGHSMGGGSAFLAAESNTDITTMVTFAAANTSPPSIAAANNVLVPSLVFAGENDCVAPPAVHQIPMYDSLGAACKTFISIKGGAHCEFANFNFNCSFGQSTCTPTPTITRTQQQDVASDFLKLWLEYYLKDMCNSWNVFNDSLSVSSRITNNQSCTIVDPVISLSGSILTSTPATTYQWFFNGSVIPGATSQNYSATVAGNYYVEVTYYNTCPYPSNTITVVATSVTTNSDLEGLSIYPNPSDEFITLIFTPRSTADISIRISNLIGEVVFQNSFSAVANQIQTHKFSLIELKCGIYFIEVRSTAFNYVEKIIKH
jgi:dienelactone hydrolase